MSELPTIGIVGGTGREGSALALRLGQAGFSVTIGSRLEERALSKARELASVLRSAGITPTLSGASNYEAVQRCELSFVAVQFPHVVESLGGLPFRTGSVIVDTSVPVSFEAGKARVAEVAGGSVSEEVRAAVPDGVQVVSAFKTIPAHVLGDLDTPLDCDLFVCGDSKEAKDVVMRVASFLPGLRPLDAGPLSVSRTIERMAVLAIQINRRYRVKAARFKLIGLEPL